MKHTEQDLERRCLAYARQHGCVCWKNEKNGCKGIPDDSVLLPSGRLMLVEFKRPDGGGVVSRWQREWMDRFPQIVVIVDDYEKFKTLIDSV